MFDIKEKKPNSKTLPNKKPSRKEENLADTHSEIKKKIDTLIAKREKVGKSEKQNLASQEKKDDSMEEIVEIRGSLKKKRVMSHLKSENASDGLNSKEEMFEITPQNRTRKQNEKYLQGHRDRCERKGNSYFGSYSGQYHKSCYSRSFQH